VKTNPIKPNGLKGSGIGGASPTLQSWIPAPSTPSLKLAPSQFYFAGGYAETSYGGQAGRGIVDEQKGYLPA